MVATYVPGTLEQDPKKVIMSLQQIGPKTDTNTANIATNTTNITALQTAGTGLTNVAGSLAVSLPKFTNSLAGDVALNNVANYFDGPSVAQPTGASAGTWWVSGSVVCTDTAGAARFNCRLWDGTTLIASSQGFVAAANQSCNVTLSGYITSPAGNLRISVKDITAATGKILFNQTGDSKDATISAIRIA